MSDREAPRDGSRRLVLSPVFAALVSRGKEGRMADPRPLFYVTAIVIAALATWVVWVLASPGPKWANEIPVADGGEKAEAKEDA